MGVLETFGLAYGSSLAVLYLYYPFRDVAKSLSNVRELGHRYDAGYFISRYRGMAQNPSQPLLLALPPAALCGGYVLVGGGLAGAVAGGFSCAAAKRFVGTVALRMSGGGGRYRELGEGSYKSLADCVLRSGRHYGPLSFFAGTLAASLVAILWHGLSLCVLQRSYGGGFGANAWEAFRTHAFLAFVTAPLRNCFHTALQRRERAGGVKSVVDFWQAEAATFREATGVARTMAREEGLGFFFHGVLRTTAKTSVPFALTYALFRQLGGSLGRPGGSIGHGMRRPPMSRIHY